MTTQVDRKQHLFDKFAGATEVYHTALEMALVTAHERGIALEAEYEARHRYEHGLGTAADLHTAICNWQDATDDHRSSMRWVTTCKLRLDAAQIIYQRELFAI